MNGSLTTFRPLQPRCHWALCEGCSPSPLDIQPRTGIPRGGLALVTLWCYFVHSRVQYSVHELASLGRMRRTRTEVRVGSGGRRREGSVCEAGKRAKQERERVRERVRRGEATIRLNLTLLHYRPISRSVGSVNRYSQARP